MLQLLLFTSLLFPLFERRYRRFLIKFIIGGRATTSRTTRAPFAGCLKSLNRNVNRLQSLPRPPSRGAFISVVPPLEFRALKPGFRASLKHQRQQPAAIQPVPCVDDISTSGRRFYPAVRALPNGTRRSSLFQPSKRINYFCGWA